MEQLNLQGLVPTSFNYLSCWMHLYASAEPWRSPQELADALVSFVQDHERTFRSLCVGARVKYDELLWRIARLEPSDDTVILLAVCWFTDCSLVGLKPDCEKHLVIFTSLPTLEQKGSAAHLPWGFNELRWRPLYDWLEALDDASRQRVYFT
eukprot:gene14168-16754_t